MAVNITFTGDIYNTNGIPFSGAEIKYQIYFVKVNGSSSSSIWSDNRTSILGQYNFNLADSDLLTTGGNVGDGDKVIIVFWKGGDSRLNNCLTLEQWGSFQIILGTGPGMVSSDVYVNNVSVSINIVPDLSWTFPVSGLVGVNYSSVNSSDDVHSFTISGTMMYHWYILEGQTIHSVNQVKYSSYYWDDGNEDLNLSGASNYSHSWSSSGVYDIDLIIEDECGSTTSGTKQIQIYNNIPTADITMTPSDPIPNTPISFQWTGSDSDDKITSIDWIINDSGSYGNTNTISGSINKNNVVEHTNGLGTDWKNQVGISGAFTNPGSHNVEIIIHWYDGFSMQQINYDEDFTQNKFSGPAVNFLQDPLKTDIGISTTFSNTSSSVSRVGTGLPNGEEYDWTWTDDGDITTKNNKNYAYELVQTPDSANCICKLCANWQDGWENQITCEEKDVIFDTVVTVSIELCYYNLSIVGTSSDGSVTGYSWTISSGISDNGPWVDIWNSPTDLYQNDKDIGFTAVSYYKITGYVYGTGITTSDDEVIYVSSVCDDGVVAVCHPNVHGGRVGKRHLIVEKEKICITPKIFMPSMRVFPEPVN